MITHGMIFSEICRPIFQSTPINYIGLAKIYQDGSRSYLISNANWGEILLQNDYHLAGTEDALLKQYDNSYYPWRLSNMFSLNKQTENLFRDCVTHNYGNGITLVEHGKEFVEFIHICANSGNEKVDDYLIHHIDSLWNFVLYIRESIFQHQDLKKAYEVRYHYHLPFNTNHHENDFDFKPTQYHLGGKFDQIYFTPREIECLILLCQHKTAKEQAIMLGLSYRTIESYFEKIKLKTGYLSQSELIFELMKNNLFKSLLRRRCVDNL